MTQIILNVRNERARKILLAALEVHRDMTNDLMVEGLPTTDRDVLNLATMDPETIAKKMAEGRETLNEGIDNVIELELLLAQLASQ